MHIEQLESIVEVARLGSLTAAANKLHVTLSAVSQSISNLEAELGVTLFTRSRQGATPTAEGQAVIAKAYEVIEKLHELREEAGRFSNEQSGELKLATIPAPLSLYIESILGFKRDYPQVQLEVTEKGSEQIVEDVLHGRVDIGLVIWRESEALQHKGLAFGKLLEGKMVVCSGRNSPLALTKSVKPDQLLGQPIVLYKDEHLRRFMDEFQARYGQVDVLFSTNNRDAIMRAIGEGAAVTVGVDFSFYNLPEQKQDDFRILDFDMPDTERLYLGWIRLSEARFGNPAKLIIQRLQHALEKL
ncbi:LysR substrate-binding domain-containing protein [Paenibacillus aurantiacus]|uniref:LysR substrate-binding domain-containing protein n=1 Tax=Paenibacillus aurantiacus TaxID=1936118 RepID=A0ABV5KY87_9BACL